MTFPITFSALKNYFLFILEVFFTKSRDLFLFIFSCFEIVRLKRLRLEKNEKKDNKKFLNSSNSVTVPKFIENTLVLCLFISILVLANKYQSLKNIFGVLGGIMGNLLSFIFPAAFYIFLVGNEGSCIELIFSIFFIFFGIFTMILCITSTILSILGKK
jgi:amino acid permease